MRLRKETTFPKKEKKEAKGSFRVLKKTSSSPSGVEKNLHPTGSIFLHKLAFWKPFTDENGFLFSLFLLKKCLCWGSAETSEKRKTNLFKSDCYGKTHKKGNVYKSTHFFILNKGLNSGKPLNEPCAYIFFRWRKRKSLLDSFQPLEIQILASFVSWLGYSVFMSAWIQKRIHA